MRRVRYEPNRSSLASLIEDGLAQKGMVRRELADRLGLVAESISKWLTLRRPDPVPWRHWRRLCKVLGIPWRRWYAVAKRELPGHAALYEKYIRQRW